ncbi:MAG: hypothetical protein F6J93_27135 [Oscillatoria sp. SIO1A7]|nr:hypothetical protein [Oscillatoria sp. SIO1A7]
MSPSLLVPQVPKSPNAQCEHTQCEHAQFPYLGCGVHGVGCRGYLFLFPTPHTPHPTPQLMRTCPMRTCPILS